MSTKEAKLEARTLKVPGATLYYEIRGSGPVLLCISGGPTDAGMFTDLAGRLADRYTVVTYDQRGHSRSTLDGEPKDIPVALHADDAAVILAALSDEPGVRVWLERRWHDRPRARRAPPRRGSPTRSGRSADTCPTSTLFGRFRHGSSVPQARPRVSKRPGGQP